MSIEDIALLLFLFVVGGVVWVGGTIVFFLLFGRWVGRRESLDEGLRALLAERPGGMLRALFGLVFETLLQSYALVLETLYLFRLLPRPRGPESGPLVVLLPGYFENGGIMWHLARHLARRGWRPILLDFPSTWQAIERNADFLHQQLVDIRDEHAVEHVAIVAHSMGGVVARTMVHRHADHAVSLIVSIASPHAGTHIAHIGLGDSIRDMRRRSEHLDRFPIDRVGDVPIHAIVAPQDEIVAPLSSCVTLEGETWVCELPLGHSGPLFTRSTWRRIVRWLEAARAPTA